jgi:uncharacterized membrane protein
VVRRRCADTHRLYRYGPREFLRADEHRSQRVVRSKDRLRRTLRGLDPREELVRLRDALGVDWDEQAKVRTFAQLRREVPGSFPWSLAHVWLTLAIVAVLGLVIGTAISASSRAS